MNSTLIIIDSTSGLVHFLPVDPQTFDWDSEEIQDAVTIEGIDANNCNWMVTDNPAFLRVGWSQ